MTKLATPALIGRAPGDSSLPVDFHFLLYSRAIGISDVAMFASVLVQALGDLHMVSRLLGHSSITVTEQHYANFDDRYLKQVFKNYKFTA